ncbi:MAG: hypothetical protein GY845_32000 [Planctomycetes bacterium]|nr:hypothetical protein [Planctomycetota bacterium]
MRILNLMLLALMLSLILAGCAAQLPQRPALVLDGFQTLHSTGERIAMEGVDIPGRGLGRGKAKCLVEVTLKSIRYYGDNIGKEWNLNVSVNSEDWDSGPEVMNWGTFSLMDVKILRDTPMACHNYLKLEFNVFARRLDDVGHGSGSTWIACLPEPRRKILIVTVPVAESPSSDKVALLDFVFIITAECVYIP